MDSPFLSRSVAYACILLAAIVVLAWATAAHGEVRINEFLAANDLGFLDEDGDSSDWIEIYNTGGAPVSLLNWTLTDDAGEPDKWAFPNITINSGEFLAVFASGKDRKPTNGENLHTNFKLSASGEFLGLYDAGGDPVVSSVFDPMYPEQMTDISFGRYPGETWFVYLDPPTPGASNMGATPFATTAGRVQFSRAGGVFTSAFSLELTGATPGAVIRYTLDGSLPTESSTLYTGGINIFATTEVRARTFGTGMFPGPVVSQAYLRLTADVYSFNSNLPIVVVDSYGYDINSESGWEGHRPIYPFRPVYSVLVETDDVSGRATITDEPDFAGRAGMKVRGNSTQILPKKQYALETWDEYDEDKDVSLLGLPPESDWVLHAPYGDKALMRNHLAYRWGGEMGWYTARTRHVEMFYNWDDNTVSMDDYAGVYVFMEKIKRDNDRVDIARLGPTDNSEPEVTGGYLLKHGFPDEDEWDEVFYTPHGIELIHMYPRVDDRTPAQEAYIRDYMDDFENALYGPDFDDPGIGYAKYIDVGTFRDYLLLTEALKNADSYYGSMFMYKDREEKLRMGPIWDWNVSLGSTSDWDCWYPYNWLYDWVGGFWFPRLRQDPEFRLLFADRWFDLRRNVLETSRLLADIDDTAALLDEAQERNFTRWPILGEYISELPHLNPANWDERDTYQEEVDWMKDWLDTRLAWLDGEIAADYAVAPPTFNQQGGPVPVGFALTISQGSPGTIYYTLDGTDPHLPATPPDILSSVDLVVEDDTRAILVPTVSNPTNYDDWRTDPGFNDSGWADGTFVSGRTGGVGYETSAGYESYISYDVETDMYGTGKNTSCYVRIPFTVDGGDLPTFNFMTLYMRYDDGFVAYINGDPVADAFAPGTLDWDSSATNCDREAGSFAEFDVSDHIGSLSIGANVLAIHGLNYGNDSSDFLMSAELVAGEMSGGSSGGLSPTAIEYTGPIILTDTTVVKARILDGSEWSAVNAATFSVGEIGDNLSITEIMYHPEDGGAEYIELHNIGSYTIDLSGVHFTQGIGFTFPANTVLAPGEYVVLVRDSDVATFGSVYPGVTIGGVYTGALNNAGEDIEVRDTEDTVLVYVDYNDAPPWPTSADGLGYSLVIIDPAADPNDPDNWRASTNSGGSPGTSVPPPGIPAVVINEALTHTDPPSVDTIEIYNPTGGTADVRGWYLTDNRTVPKKAMIPDEPQYNIAPGGYAIITEDDFGYDPGPGLPGFFLSSHGGEGVYVYSADVGGNITGYSQGFEFNAAENGVSFGRHVSSDDIEHFVAQSSNSLGSANAGPKVGPLVISEIYYHPAEGEIEYIELTNISGATVNLWDDSGGGEPNNTYMVNGIGFAFDPGTTIGPGEILIVADTHSPKTTEPTYGPFGGGSVLDSAGETLTLLWPDTPDYSYVPYIVMDKVRYDDESPWPDADGNGMALRRIDNFAFGNDPANWEAVTPTHYPGGFPLVWVDFAFGGTEQGTQTNPYNTLDEGLSVVSLGGTLRVKSDSAVTSTSWTGRITDPVRIEPFPAGSVRIGDVGGGSSGKAKWSRASSITADNQRIAGGAVASGGVDVASVQDGADSAVIVSRGPETTVRSVHGPEGGVVGIATEARDDSDEPLEREDTAFVPVASLMGLAALVAAMACVGLVMILRRPRRCSADLS